MTPAAGLGRPGRARSAAEPTELAELRGWLRARKIAAKRTDGKRATFQDLADRTHAGDKEERERYGVSACTLRQALDGRLPTLRTVLAFTYGTGGAAEDLEKAEQLWTAAERAANPPPRKRPAPYVPNHFTVPAGLVRAMDGVRATAPRTGLRTLAGRAGLSVSTLRRILTGRRMPSAEELVAFASACNASAKATAALLAGHQRILAGPPRPVPHPCARAEWVEDRRLRDATVRHWQTEPDLGWDDQQRLAEEEVDFRRRAADAENLLGEREADAGPARGSDAGTVPSAGDGALRSELAAIAARAQRAPGQ
ncbi:helix-turn-helix transcriptional regulator [Streptomyces sp. NPDC030392]|uniref:helix-turn-helix domain-containing protein n=1 Tax=Streptomyces sp. NPDC030392 TaxID=3155468 RepID=UPI0033EEC232